MYQVVLSDVLNLRSKLNTLIYVCARVVVCVFFLTDRQADRQKKNVCACIYVLFHIKVNNLVRIMTL